MSTSFQIQELSHWHESGGGGGRRRQLLSREDARARVRRLGQLEGGDGVQRRHRRQAEPTGDLVS